MTNKYPQAGCQKCTITWQGHDCQDMAIDHCRYTSHKVWVEPEQGMSYAIQKEDVSLPDDDSDMPMGFEKITMEQAQCDHEFSLGYGQTPYKGVYSKTCKKCGYVWVFDK